MKRLVLPIGTLALLAQLAGCGADSPPPADGSNLPTEVQEYEKRQQAEFEKLNAGKAPKPRPK